MLCIHQLNTQTGRLALLSGCEQRFALFWRSDARTKIEQTV